VAAGQVRFVLVGGNGFGGGPGGDSAVMSWVTANCTPITVGGTSIYDCATPAS